MRFKDKVAIVTSGASGIGAATVRALAKEGAKVLVADINLFGFRYSDFSTHLLRSGYTG